MFRTLEGVGAPPEDWTTPNIVGVDGSCCLSLQTGIQMPEYTRRIFQGKVRLVSIHGRTNNANRIFLLPLLRFKEHGVNVYIHSLV